MAGEEEGDVKEQQLQTEVALVAGEEEGDMKEQQLQTEVVLVAGEEGDVKEQHGSSSSS